MSSWTDVRNKLRKDGKMNNFKDMKMRAEQMARPQALAPNLLPGITPKDLVTVKCNNCSGEIFTPAHLLKFASRFQSRNGQPTMVQFPLGFMCATCNQINPFDIEQLSKVIQDGQKLDAADQDGQKLVSKEETNNPPDLGVSVDDGVKTKEKLN